MKLKLYYILSSGQTGHLNMPCQTPREFQCSIPGRRRKLGWRQALWHKTEFQREMGLQQLRCLGGLLQSQGQLCLPAEFQANSSYIRGPCLRKAKVKQVETTTNKTKTICGGEKGKIFSFNQLQLRWSTFYILLSKPKKKKMTCQRFARAEATGSGPFKRLLPMFRSALQVSPLEWSLFFRVSETTIPSSHPIPPFLA